MYNLTRMVGRLCRRQIDWNVILDSYNNDKFATYFKISVCYWKIEKQWKMKWKWTRYQFPRQICGNPNWLESFSNDFQKKKQKHWNETNEVVNEKGGYYSYIWIELIEIIIIKKKNKCAFIITIISWVVFVLICGWSEKNCQFQLWLASSMKHS